MNKAAMRSLWGMGAAAPGLKRSLNFKIEKTSKKCLSKSAFPRGSAEKLKTLENI